MATAGALAVRGFQVTLALRHRERFAELFETGRLKLSGAVEAVAELAAVTDDHPAAVRGAEPVLIPLPTWRLWTS